MKRILQGFIVALALLVTHPLHVTAGSSDRLYLKTRAIEKYKTLSIEELQPAPSLEDIIGLQLINRYVETGNPRDFIVNPFYELKTIWTDKYISDFADHMKHILEMGMQNKKLDYSIRALLRDVYAKLPLAMTLGFYIEQCDPMVNDEL